MVHIQNWEVINFHEAPFRLSQPLWQDVLTFINLQGHCLIYHQISAFVQGESELQLLMFCVFDSEDYDISVRWKFAFDIFFSFIKIILTAKESAVFCGVRKHECQNFFWNRVLFVSRVN